MFQSMKIGGLIQVVVGGTIIVCKVCLLPLIFGLKYYSQQFFYGFR
jgi:hypothetical protein